MSLAITGVIINKLGLCPKKYAMLFSIIIGILLYIVVYMIFSMMNWTEYLSILSQFWAYIIAVDVILFTFYSVNAPKTQKRDPKSGDPQQLPMIPEEDEEDTVEEESTSSNYDTLVHHKQELFEVTPIVPEVTLVPEVTFVPHVPHIVQEVPQVETGSSPIANPKNFDEYKEPSVVREGAAEEFISPDMVENASLSIIE